MKKNITQIVSSFIAFNIILAISSFDVVNGQSALKTEIDPVCGMKVAKTQALTYKYEGKDYYFDNNNCKETFSMNPQKFIPKKDSSEYAKDPVCGMRVIKSAAISYVYENNTNYFDKESCKQAFIMNPQKYVNIKKAVK
jgi:YHS domain-containing protein